MCEGTSSSVCTCARDTKGDMVSQSCMEFCSQSISFPDTEADLGMGLGV